jgi:DNA-binding FadR family transcriptional regulator
MPIETIQSKRLFEKIAEQIKMLIASGEFKEGSRLPPERDLALQLGVSRPTVREAMIALELSGLVEVRVGAGIYVISSKPRLVLTPNSKIKVPSPSELIEARLMVEPNNAALAAERFRPELIDDLERAIKQQITEDAIGADADRQFHMIIAEATGNRALVEMTEYLWDQMLSSHMWRLLIDHAQLKGLYPIILDDHRNLLDALIRRDSETAKNIMKSHLEHAKEIFFDIVSHQAKD